MVRLAQVLQVMCPACAPGTVAVVEPDPQPYLCIIERKLNSEHVRVGKLSLDVKSNPNGTSSMLCPGNAAPPQSNQTKTKEQSIKTGARKCIRQICECNKMQSNSVKCSKFRDVITKRNTLP